MFLLAFTLFSCARPPLSARADLDFFDGVFVDSSGRSGRYRLAVPPPSGEPLGVLFFFPWDGGGPAYAREAARREALAAEHHLVIAALRQPEGRCWWAPEVEDNARFVDELLRQELIEAQGVDPNRVFLTGLSGGADFAAAFPYHVGFAYGGGVVALCGGDLPRQNGGDCASEANPPEAPPLAGPPPRLDIRYDFGITADDSLRPASEAAAAYYRAAGFEVRHRVLPGSGHCGFDEGFEAMGALAEGLDFVDP